MPILNYTTEVAASKTAGELTGFLAARGARSIQLDFDNGGEPVGLHFAVEVAGVLRGYALPCRAEGVLAALKKDRKVEARYRNLPQAHRVAWRILKDWLLAQFALIDAGAADLPEVFLPYMLVSPGETAYGRFQRTGSPLELPAGGGR